MSDPLKHFREVYNAELDRIRVASNELEILFFNHQQTRAFVYEVCKGVLNHRPTLTTEPPEDGVWDGDEYYSKEEIDRIWQRYDKLVAKGLINPPEPEGRE